jgi:hypothetical protein
MPQNMFVNCTKPFTRFPVQRCINDILQSNSTYHETEPAAWLKPGAKELRDVTPMTWDVLYMLSF